MPRRAATGTRDKATGMNPARVDPDEACHAPPERSASRSLVAAICPPGLSALDAGQTWPGPRSNRPFLDSTPRPARLRGRCPAALLGRRAARYRQDVRWRRPAKRKAEANPGVGLVPASEPRAAGRGKES